MRVCLSLQSTLEKSLQTGLEPKFEEANDTYLVCTCQHIAHKMLATSEDVIATKSLCLGVQGPKGIDNIIIYDGVLHFHFLLEQCTCSEPVKQLVSQSTNIFHLPYSQRKVK